MIIGHKVAKETGLDPQAKVCPHHPRVTINEVHTILMKPFKTYRYDKKLKRDIVDRMGSQCPRCGFVELVSKDAEQQQIAIPEEDQGQAVKTKIKLTPAELGL